MLRTHPRWIENFLVKSQTEWNRVTKNALFTEIAERKLPVQMVQFAVKNFYPFIESFPKYLALMLSRIPSGGAKEVALARQWLMENLHVEERHAKWFIDLGVGFGLSRSIFSSPIRPPAQVDAINNYLWRVSTQGSLAECFGAVNFAMEGPTGEWTKATREGFKRYEGTKDTDFCAGTLAWIDAHAMYDDDHVEGALRLMALFARTPAEQEKATAAAIRSLEYYAMAVEACYLLSQHQTT
jgi:pyrroloquinoline quinone (PQQ) biosynthesis protein C